jgi:hypothetical protein
MFNRFFTQTYLEVIAMKTRLITLSSFICLLGLTETQVWAADVVMFSTTRTTTTTINNADSDSLPLDNAGTTTLEPFAGSNYLIHFHAECSVKADDDNTSLSIAIVVDPGEPDEQMVSPTGLNRNELCTSIKPNPGESAKHHRFSVGTSVLVSVSGHEFHQIEVHRQISSFNPGEEAIIDEISLAVVAQ